MNPSHPRRPKSSYKNSKSPKPYYQLRNDTMTTQELKRKFAEAEKLEQRVTNHLRVIEKSPLNSRSGSQFPSPKPSFLTRPRLPNSSASSGSISLLEENNFHAEVRENYQYYSLSERKRTKLLLLFEKKIEESPEKYPRLLQNNSKALLTLVFTLYEVAERQLNKKFSKQKSISERSLSSREKDLYKSKEEIREKDEEIAALRAKLKKKDNLIFSLCERSQLFLEWIESVFFSLTELFSLLVEPSTEQNLEEFREEAQKIIQVGKMFETQLGRSVEDYEKCEEVISELEEERGQLKNAFLDLRASKGEISRGIFSLNKTIKKMEEKDNRIELTKKIDELGTLNSRIISEKNSVQKKLEIIVEKFTLAEEKYEELELELRNQKDETKSAEDTIKELKLVIKSKEKVYSISKKLNFELCNLLEEGSPSPQLQMYRQANPELEILCKAIEQKLAKFKMATATHVNIFFKKV